MLFRLTKEGHPFPIEHPYASMFRQMPHLIERNPLIFQQLGQTVISMNVQDVIKGCERPADINRIVGSAFHTWLKRFFTHHGYRFLSEYQFEREQDIAFLDATDASILKFINRKFNLNYDRGRDLLVKKGDKYIVGEARFLSTSGGSQNSDVGETINFVKNAKRHLVAIAIIDGIVWFNRSYQTMLQELEEDEPALSALLLEDFLDSVR